MAAADRHSYTLLPAIGRTGVLAATAVHPPVGAAPVPDVTAPVISNLTPTPGTSVAANQFIGFDVTDNAGTPRRVFLAAAFSRLPHWEVVHDGDVFGPNYEAGSSRSGIANGYRYSVVRAGGWPGPPTLTPIALDSAGNENV